MKLVDCLTCIENCSSLQELQAAIETILDGYGFASFAFVAAGGPGQSQPFVLTNNDKTWDETYRTMDFARFDPVSKLARRSNLMFNWGGMDGTAPQDAKAREVMRTARDFGYREGLVVPFHYSDALGRRYSSCCTLFWKNRLHEFKALFQNVRTDIHVVMLYWAQRASDIVAQEYGTAAHFLDTDTDVAPKLTPREQDVTAWAARGKTVLETADILGISYDTVETHMRHAMRKLNAHTKTQAVVKAIYLGLVEI